MAKSKRPAEQEISVEDIMRDAPLLEDRLRGLAPDLAEPLLVELASHMFRGFLGPAKDGVFKESSDLVARDIASRLARSHLARVGFNSDASTSQVGRLLDALCAISVRDYIGQIRAQADAHDEEATRRKKSGEKGSQAETVREQVRRDEIQLASFGWVLSAAEHLPPEPDEPDPAPWLRRQIAEISRWMAYRKALVRLQSEQRRRGRPTRDPTLSILAEFVGASAHGQWTRADAELGIVTLAKDALGIEITKEQARKLLWRQWSKLGEHEARAKEESQSPGERLAETARLERGPDDRFVIIAHRLDGDRVEIPTATRNVDEAQAILDAKQRAWITGDELP